MLLFALVVAVPSQTSAYFTTAQEGVAVTTQTALFTLTFTFGHKNYDLLLPIAAVRDIPHDNASTQAGYEIRIDQQEHTHRGATTALILSEAEKEGAFYRVPKGRSETFTLVVILTLPEETPEADYSVHMTALPFFMGEEQTPQALTLPELSHYLTPEVELNEPRASNESTKTRRGIRINVIE